MCSGFSYCGKAGYRLGFMSLTDAISCRSTVEAAREATTAVLNGLSTSPATQQRRRRTSGAVTAAAGEASPAGAQPSVLASLAGRGRKGQTVHTTATAANGDGAHAAGGLDVPEAVPETEAAAANGVHSSNVTSDENIAAVSPAKRKPAVKRARKATAKATSGPGSPSAEEPAVLNGTDPAAMLAGGESAAGPTDRKPAVKRVRKAKASAKAGTTAQDADSAPPVETAVMPKVKRSKKTRAPPAAVPDGEQAELQVGADAAADEGDEDPAPAEKPKAKRRKKAQAEDAAADDGEEGADDQDDAEEEGAAGKKPRKNRAPKVTWPPGGAVVYESLPTQRAVCV